MKNAGLFVGYLPTDWIKVMIAVLLVTVNVVTWGSLAAKWLATPEPETITIRGRTAPGGFNLRSDTVPTEPFAVEPNANGDTILMYWNTMTTPDTVVWMPAFPWTDIQTNSMADSTWLRGTYPTGRRVYVNHLSVP